MKPRFWSIDVLRGIAVLAMVVFHFLFDYNFFAGARFDLYSGTWFLLGRLAAVLFVLLAGMSVVFRVQRRELEPDAAAMQLILRGIFLLVLGFVITMFTLLFFPDYPVWFGVLHLLGLATILSIPLVSRPRLALIAGALLSVLGVLVSLGLLAVPRILPLFDFSFATFDYFPLLPWLGVFWIGLWAGNRFWNTAGESWKAHPPKWLFWTRLDWLGRHSLVIYFVHQFVLFGILAVLAYAGALRLF
ncbi:MAG: heparan-alpha-glucosaminide N-acetyltransferase [Candidatus Diapherotrites archaeon]|nr:heparan-alpha-glucosaminide N-acetyltransferase [Candidatus Diapherotrites archaeon]